MKQILLVSLLTPLLLGIAHSQAQGKTPCSLLTSNDVSAIGATGQGIPSDMPITSGEYKGQTMRMCSWRMKVGGLHLGANPMPPGTSRAALETLLTQSYQALAAKGWKQQKKDFGNVTCSAFLPPPGDKEAPNTTMCLAVTKGMVVNADTLSITTVPMEKLKTLVDAATGRL